MQWDNALIPDMNTKRSRLSCAYVESTNALFAVAGYEGAPLTSVEFIVIGDASWQLLPESLSEGGGFGTQSVVLHELIFVIGKDNFGGTYSDAVYIIDPSNNNELTLMEDRLPEAIAHSACTAA